MISLFNVWILGGVKANNKEIYAKGYTGSKSNVFDYLCKIEQKKTDILKCNIYPNNDRSIKIQNR